VGKLQEHKYANLQILEVYSCSLMFLYTIKCVAYAETHKLKKKLLQRLHGLMLGMILKRKFSHAP